LSDIMYFSSLGAKAQYLGMKCGRGRKPSLVVHYPAYSDCPRPHISVGGWLTHFLQTMQEIVTDVWVLQIVTERLSFIVFPQTRNINQIQSFQEALTDRLTKAAIEIVPEPIETRLYSLLFLVPKMGGELTTSHRPEHTEHFFFFNCSLLQDGNFSIHHSCYTAKSMGLQTAAL